VVEERKFVNATPGRHQPRQSQNTTWKDFIARHMAVLAGTDFFTVEVLT